MIYKLTIEDKIEALNAVEKKWKRILKQLEDLYSTYINASIIPPVIGDKLSDIQQSMKDGYGNDECKLCTLFWAKSSGQCTDNDGNVCPIMTVAQGCGSNTWWYGCAYSISVKHTIDHVNNFLTNILPAARKGWLK
jgi:hypothetical protein